MKIIPKAVIT